MKKNLLKSLSMTLVALATVVVVAMGVSKDVKASSIENTEWTLVSYDVYGEHYVIGDDFHGLIVTENSIKVEFGSGNLVSINGEIFEYVMEDTLEEIEWTETAGSYIVSVENVVFTITVSGNTATLTESCFNSTATLSKKSAPPTPDPTPTPCEPEKKPAKKNIEITPYLISVFNEILNKNKAQNAVAVDVPREVVVDKDTCKSEAPHNTAGLSNNNSKIGDLKVHTVNATTEANQKLLADTFAQQNGKRARILVNASVHPRRDLGADNGIKEVLIWANLEKVAQPVYAVCYNQTDKAYYISGLLDGNGVAKLNDFILRDATNVTIFVLE